MLASQLMFLNIATFLPPFIKERFPNFSSGVTGFILSIYQLASLISSPLIGAKLAVIGRKNSMVIGYILIIASTIGFA
jgi:MFS family permease